MAIRLSSTPVHNQMPNVAQYRDDRQIIFEQQVNKGMFSTIDPADIPEGGLSKGENVNVRYDKTSRRYGNSLYTPSAPDGNHVDYLSVWARNSGSVNLVRFANNTVKLGSSSSWTTLTGTVAPTIPKYRSIVANDRFFFVSDGTDYIQEINTGANTYARLGNAPHAKYLVAFGNHIVGLNCDGDPNRVAWSGDGNYAVWDSVTDISAGFQDLIDIALNYSDPISGGFATDNRMIILRERSIWLAIRQASGTQPFYFQLAVSNNGCDCPYTAVQVPLGVCYTSFRYRSVYVYYPGMPQPQRIGLPIELLLSSQIQSLTDASADYDAQNNEYQLIIPQSSGMSVIWKYNFNTQAWCYDIISGANCIAFLDFASASVSMDDLLGVMDALPGTMDSLSVTPAAVPTRLIGMTNGTILQENTFAINDNGVAFTHTIAGRTYAIPELNCIFAEERFYIVPTTTGTINISLSKNDGFTYTLVKSATITSSDLANPVIIKAKRPFNSRRMMWMLTSSDVNFQLNGVEIHYFPTGESKK